MKTKVKLPQRTELGGCAMQENYLSVLKLFSPEGSCHSKPVFNARSVLINLVH